MEGPTNEERGATMNVDNIGPVTKPPLEFDWSDWKEAAESIPLTASRFISHCMSTFLNIVSWIVVVRCNLPGPCFRSVV